MSDSDLLHRNTSASNTPPLQLYSNTHARNSIMRTSKLSTVHGSSGYQLRELIEYPPHKKGYVVSGRRIDDCLLCGDRFGHSGQGLYCSNACKQKASRIRAGRSANRHEAAQKAVRTKQSTSVEVICECCQLAFYVSGSSAGLQMYCTPACKQKAYRQRKVKP